jgi:hypothetical protein
VAQSSGKTKNKMGRRRPEGHITDARNTYRDVGDERKTGKNESVFGGMPIPRTGCSAVDGWMD